MNGMQLQLSIMQVPNCLLVIPPLIYTIVSPSSALLSDAGIALQLCQSCGSAVLVTHPTNIIYDYGKIAEFSSYSTLLMHPT